MAYQFEHIYIHKIVVITSQITSYYQTNNYIIIHYLLIIYREILQRLF